MCANKSYEVKEMVEYMTESMDNYQNELDSSFRKISEGDIITGTIIGITEDEVTLDLKYYTQGIIRTQDLSNDPNFSVFEELKLEDEISATVIRMDDGHGNILLSRKEADNILAWDKLKSYYDEELTLSVKISEIVPAGVITYVEGIRGFIPASQLTIDYVEDCTPWLHKTLEARIITLNENNGKLVLSSKVIEQEKAKAELSHKVAMLLPGAIVEGTVESIMPYGAFVNIGDGLSGLVHISQICQKRIASPNEVLKTGQKVRAKILNTNDGKISLSMKALEDIMTDESIKPEEREAIEYSDGASASISLGDLLKNIKL